MSTPSLDDVPWAPLEEIEGAHFQGVPSDKIDAIWPHVEGMLENAITRAADGKYLAEDVLEMLRAKEMQLWLGYDQEGAALAVVTQILIYPRKRSLLLFAVAGRNGRMKKHWWRFLPLLEAFAREKDCQSIEGYGRKGWLKKAPHNYEITHVIWRRHI